MRANPFSISAIMRMTGLPRPCAKAVATSSPNFPEFRDPATRAKIPDPNAPETFARSQPRLDGGAEWRAFYKELLTLRRTHIVPRLKGLHGGGRGCRRPKGSACVLAHERWCAADPPGQSRPRACVLSASVRNAHLGSRRNTLLDRTMTSDAALYDRARKAGLAPDWIDATGHPKTVSPDTLRTVLAALGGYEATEAQPGEVGTCFSVGEAAAGRRVAGLAVQLYALRGSNGFGDLGALARFARAAGPLGIEALAVSPIHAPFLAAVDEHSPYAPSSRLFPQPALCGGGRARRRLDGLVDWPAASRAKLARLRAAFGKAPSAPADGRLRDHARFEVLDAYFREQRLYRWQDWPLAYRDPRSSAVEAFAHDHQDDVDFHVFPAKTGRGQPGRGADRRPRCRHGDRPDRRHRRRHEPAWQPRLERARRRPARPDHRRAARHLQSAGPELGPHRAVAGGRRARPSPTPGTPRCATPAVCGSTMRWAWPGSG